MPPWPFGSLKSQGMTLGESEQVKDDLTRVLREAGSTRVGMTGTTSQCGLVRWRGRWRRCRRTSRR